MPIPESDRIIYRSNPLIEVVCQVRFPTILRIESEPPALFQDGVRKQYPIFNEPSIPMLAGPQQPADLVALFNSLVPLRIPKAYEFRSEDENWKLTLSQEFFALSCSKYERWEDFRAHVEPPLALFVREYQPAFFSRVGLRYRNLLRREILQLTDAKWSDLLKAHIAGPLATEIADEVEGVFHQVSFELPNTHGKVTMQHGFTQGGQSREICYLIDNDFYTERRTEIGHAIEDLNHFNRYSGGLFRWSITERLHQAMGPQPVTP